MSLFICVSVLFYPVYFASLSDTVWCIKKRIKTAQFKGVKIAVGSGVNQEPVAGTVLRRCLRYSAGTDGHWSGQCTKPTVWCYEDDRTVTRGIGTVARCMGVMRALCVPFDAGPSLYCCCCGCCCCLCAVTASQSTSSHRLWHKKSIHSSASGGSQEHNRASRSASYQRPTHQRAINCGLLVH